MIFKRIGGEGQRPFEQCSKKLHFSLVMASLIPQNAGGRQSPQVEDVVPDQRHEEHDRGEEDPTKPKDERQDERGGKSEVVYYYRTSRSTCSE